MKKKMGIMIESACPQFCPQMYHADAMANRSSFRVNEGSIDGERERERARKREETPHCRFLLSSAVRKKIPRCRKIPRRDMRRSRRVDTNWTEKDDAMATMIMLMCAARKETTNGRSNRSVALASSAVASRVFSYVCPALPCRVPALNWRFGVSSAHDNCILQFHLPRGIRQTGFTIEFWARPETSRSVRDRMFRRLLRIPGIGELRVEEPHPVRRHNGGSDENDGNRRCNTASHVSFTISPLLDRP